MAKRIGEKLTPVSKYAYGDPAEISNRDKGGFQNKPTAFRQIGPEDRGGNLNEPSHVVRSGRFRFNPPVS